MDALLERPKTTFLHGNALEQLAFLPNESVQCCVTSPPYWGLREYGMEGQLGLEKTPDEYIAKMVAVFKEVKRVLKNDGVLWLNLGDSYAPKPLSFGIKAKDLMGIPWMLAFALRSDGWYLRQAFGINLIQCLKVLPTDVLNPTNIYSYLVNHLNIISII